MDGNLELAWTTIEILAFIGVMLGVVVGIVFGFAKLGFQYAPFIVAVAVLIWYFQQEIIMFTPETMEPGKGYECTFTVKNIPLDEFGRPGGMMSLADIPVEKIGDYTSTGAIVARDLNTKLMEVEDSKVDGKPKTYVVKFLDVENINEV